MKDYRINQEIKAPSVRFKDSQELVSTACALKMAIENNTDLIELSTYDNNNVSVCILQDYQKFLYKQKKKEKELKASQAKAIVKELRFGCQTDEHDYAFKLKHAREFILQKARVLATVTFKGREISFTEQGEAVLLRLASDMEDIAKVISMPKLEGKRMSLVLMPK